MGCIEFVGVLEDCSMLGEWLLVGLFGSIGVFVLPIIRGYCRLTWVFYRLCG